MPEGTLAASPIRFWFLRFGHPAVSKAKRRAPLDKLGTGAQSLGAMSASHREPNTTRAGTSVLHSGDQLPTQAETFLTNFVPEDSR